MPAAQTWAEKGFDFTIKKVLIEMEKAERQTAQGRGKRAGDAGESAAGGEQAKARWALLRAGLLAANKFYEDDMDDRIIEVALDEMTGQPTAEAVAAVKTALE